MAKIRYAVLENDVAKASATTSGTETIDLPETGILMQVDSLIRFSAPTVDNFPIPRYHAIKKMELLVDGSTVVKSLDGRQVLALNWFSNGPTEVINNYRGGSNSNKTYHNFPLYLGRFMGDMKYGLDLDRYSNPQLKITWDTNQTAFDGVTYDASATPTFTYNIMAKIMDGTPAGFTNRYVQSREVDSYNPGTDSETNTEIPRGYDLKGIMFGSRYTQKRWYEAMDHIKLDFDNGKWLPIDMDYENVEHAYKSWFPRPFEHAAWYAFANGNDFDTNVMEVSNFQAAQGGNTTVNAQWQSHEFPIHTISKRTTSDNTAQTTNDAMWLSIRGWGPYQNIYFPMNQLQDAGQEAIDTKQYGRIDFKVTTKSYTASAVSQVVAEYLKPNEV